MKSVQQSKRVKERFDVELGGITQGISIITDNKTGVQYLAVNNSGISVIVDKVATSTKTISFFLNLSLLMVSIAFFILSTKIASPCFAHIYGKKAKSLRILNAAREGV